MCKIAAHSVFVCFMDTLKCVLNHSENELFPFAEIDLRPFTHKPQPCQVCHKLKSDSQYLYLIELCLLPLALKVSSTSKRFKYLQDASCITVCYCVHSRYLGVVIISLLFLVQQLIAVNRDSRTLTFCPCLVMLCCSPTISLLCSPSHFLPLILSVFFKLKFPFSASTWKPNH